MTCKNTVLDLVFVSTIISSLESVVPRHRPSYCVYENLNELKYKLQVKKNYLIVIQLTNSCITNNSSTEDVAVSFLSLAYLMWMNGAKKKTKQIVHLRVKGNRN